MSYLCVVAQANNTVLKFRLHWKCYFADKKVVPVKTTGVYVILVPFVSVFLQNIWTRSSIREGGAFSPADLIYPLIVLHRWRGWWVNIFWLKYLAFHYQKWASNSNGVMLSGTWQNNPLQNHSTEATCIWPHDDCCCHSFFNSRCLWEASCALILVQSSIRLVGSSPWPIPDCFCFCDPLLCLCTQDLGDPDGLSEGDAVRQKSSTLQQDVTNTAQAASVDSRAGKKTTKIT